MLRSFARLCVYASCRRGVSTAEAAPSSAVVLPIYASCVLARAPLVKPLPEDWEVEYQTWAEQLRQARKASLPSSWEKAKKTEPGEHHDDAVEGLERVQEWEEAPRVTEADRQGDAKSLMRCLDRYLYLVVKSRERGWGFPTAAVAEGETLRVAADRALKSCLMPTADTFSIANWPIVHCVLDQETPPRVEYFMKAQILSGKTALQAETEWRDYAWIPKTEFEQYLQNAALRERLSKALL